ncbi:MAG TPA: YCF48-related protein [Candidatus Marinimicrobia bacterium]|nr:YCF48-related protein [Candidatus Neomarinimicrobiota bacterium]
MKKSVKVYFILIIFCTSYLFSQDGWIVQNNGTTATLTGICFSTADTGYIVGYSGTVLHTTNQGKNWIPIDLQTTIPLKDVAFNSSRQGIIIGGDFGGYPKWYSTSDGGQSWTFGSLTTWLYYAVDYTDDVITAVGYMGIIKRSYDNGVTWISKSSGIWPAPSQYSGICFIDSDTGFVVGGDGIIIYTENGGDVWTQQNSNITTGLIGIDFTDTNTGMVVGVNGTILKTTDAGNTWTQLVSGTDLCLYDVVMINKNKAIAIGNGGTILCTINGGETWTQQECPVTEDLFSICAIDDSTLFIIGDNGTILFTNDGGEIASPEIPELMDPEDNSVNLQTNVTLSWCSSIHASSYEVQIAYCDDFSDIYLDTTVVGDTTFQLYHLSAGTTYFWRVRAKNISGNSDWTSPPRQFTTIEDITWYWEKLNFPGQDGIKQLIADSSGGIIAVVNDALYHSIFYRSVDIGNTWDNTGEASDLHSYFTLSGRNYIFAQGPQQTGATGESIWRSNDFGKTWEMVHFGDYAADVYKTKGNRLGHLYILYNKAVEPKFYLKFSLDYGNHCKYSTVSWSEDWYSMHYIDFSVIDSSHIFVSRNNCLSLTTDDGISWDTLLVISENDYIKSITINRFNQIFAICDSSGVFRSTDYGQNWDNIGISDTKLTSFSFIGSDTIIAVSADQGIFSSFDNGDHWIQRNSGLSNFNICAISIDKGNSVYIANDDGLYRNSALWINPVEEDLKIPDKFILKQNYPNPFNSSTTIRFTLPNEDKVTVSVFDIRGRFISNLHNGQLNKGSHKFFWNASYLSSGIYFCCVQIGNRTYSQKMLLIK